MQSNAGLYAQGAATRIDNVVEVWREVNMAVGSGDVIKTIELQLYVPP